MQYFEARDIEILYSKGVKNPVAVTTLKSTYGKTVAIKHDGGIVPLDTKSTKFYYCMNKKGVSRLTTAVLGATLGPIASAASMWNGLGYTRIVYIALSNGGVIVIKCGDNYFKYIKTYCKKGELDAEAEQEVINKL